MEKFILQVISTFVSHDRAFIYEPRGFKNIYEMNETIIKNYNNVVQSDDDVYCLGDCMLNDNELGIKCIKQLKGNIHIVLGNHDTDTRKELYKTCYNVIEVELALKLKYKDYHFFLTHYPCFTGNLEKESLKQCTCNLYGHTHQSTNFYQDIPFMYHVGVDSHNCTPVSIDQIILEMNNKATECIKQL